MKIENVRDGLMIWAVIFSAINVFVMEAYPDSFPYFMWAGFACLIYPVCEIVKDFQEWRGEKPGVSFYRWCRNKYGEERE